MRSLNTIAFIFLMNPSHAYAQTKAVTNCKSSYAKPIGDLGYFDLQNKYFYHFTKINSSTDPKTRNIMNEYEVNRVDLEKRTKETLATFKMSEVHAIIPQTTTKPGITTITYEAPFINCKSGAAHVINFSLDTQIESQTPKVQKLQYNLELAESVQNLMLFNKDKNSYIEFDFSTFQSRQNPSELREGEHPLFIDINKRFQYVWKEPTKTDPNKGIIAYKNNKDIAGNIKFEDTDKVLQQKNLFAVLQQTNIVNNEITIKELKGWTGVNADQNYKTKLPKAFKLQDAEISPIFKDQKILVIANSLEKKKAWKDFVIINYKHNKSLNIPKTGKNEYTSYAGISFNGKYLIVAISDLKTDFVKQLKLYIFAEKKWITL